MVPIRKGDGTGLAAKGYSQVRKGDGTVLWNAIPDSDLYYPVDEGSGTTLNDAVSTNHASITGSPNWVSDSDYWGGFYLDFTEGDYAEISDNSILGLEFDWSVAVTIIADGSLSDRGVVWNWSNGTDEIGLSIQNESDIAAGWYDGSNWQIEIGESLPPTPFTIRATVRWDSSDNSMELFTNASEVTGSVQPTAIQSGDRFIINESALFSGRQANEGLDAFRVNQDHIDPQTDYDDQPWS